MSQSARVSKNDTKILSGTTFGSLDLRYTNFIITTTGAATATLPSGTNGQIVYIILEVDGGDLVITGDFETGNTATFSDAKDNITFKWSGRLGWCTISNGGVYIVNSDLVIPVKNTIQVFGDSLSDSRSPQFQETWAMRIGSILGKTITGTGISGNRTDQMIQDMYLNRSISSTDSAAIFIGTNDLNSQTGILPTGVTNVDAIIEQICANAVTGALYCSIPGSSKYNARSSGAIKTGTWFNTPSFASIGVGSSTNNSYITQIVTGRYVSFTITSVNQVSSPSNQTLTGPKFNYSITNTVTDLAGTIGTISNTTDPVFPGTMQTSPRISGGFLIRTYVFDTEVDGTHTIQVTLTDDAGGDIFVDWFAGWTDVIDTGNPTIVLGVPAFQYLRMINSDPTTTFINDDRRCTYNKQLKRNCDMYRKRFKVPIYYVESGATPGGATCSDGLHLLRHGQRFLGDTVIAAISGTPYDS
jgi:hypothetical protein